MEGYFYKSADFTLLQDLEYSCQEAFNTLSTNLSFAGRDKKVIMITSSFPSEGKSFTALNLARTLGSIGYQVLLVDADLRASRTLVNYGVQFSGEKPHDGLSHYLAGICGMQSIFYHSNMPNVDFIPVGRNVKNSLTLLAGHPFKDLLNNAAANYDYVIVDSPPVGVIIDAAEIAKTSDAAVIVSGYGEARKRTLREVQAQLKRANCPVLGVVLNKVNVKDLSNKKYYYNKDYYSSYYGKAEDE